MKRIALCLLLSLMAGNLLADEATWLTSVPEAQALAKKENKLILMDFTGSDWCVWCKKLDADIFSKPEFSEYAKKNLVLVQLDFPDAKPQSPELKRANNELQSKYKIEGFPTLILIKPDGTVVWQRAGYLPGGPSALSAVVEKAKQS